MFDVAIPIDADVEAVDGTCGHVICLIVDPVQEKVTHLVVEEAGPSHVQRLLPIGMVHGTRLGAIDIRCGTEEFKKMEPFVEKQFLPGASQADANKHWPYVEPEADLGVPQNQKIPAGELPIRRGTPVRAADGEIGQVDELMVDRKDGSITHLVLREGHLWGEKDISISVSAISSIDREEVRLKISKEEVEKLPEIPIHRRRR